MNVNYVNIYNTIIVQAIPVQIIGTIFSTKNKSHGEYSKGDLDITEYIIEAFAIICSQINQKP